MPLNTRAHHDLRQRAFLPVLAGISLAAGPTGLASSDASARPCNSCPPVGPPPSPDINDRRERAMALARGARPRFSRR
jgi:hypothetical protein